MFPIVFPLPSLLLLLSQLNSQSVIYSVKVSPRTLPSFVPPFDLINCIYFPHHPPLFPLLVTHCTVTLAPSPPSLVSLVHIIGQCLLGCACHGHTCQLRIKCCSHCRESEVSKQLRQPVVIGSQQVLNVASPYSRRFEWQKKNSK